VLRKWEPAARRTSEADQHRAPREPLELIARRMPLRHKTGNAAAEIGISSANPQRWPKGFCGMDGEDRRKGSSPWGHG